jgi:adenosine deaminase
LGARERPKVELHCHLDGIVDPAMAREIRREQPNFPVDPEELERTYPVDGFERFLGWWTVPNRLEGHLDNFRPVLEHHIRRLKAQRVVYTEIMIGSSEFPRDPAEAQEKLSAFRQWVNGLEGGQIQVEFLLVFSRSQSPERAEAFVDRNLRLHAAGLIAGIALAGPEQGFPVRPLHKSFARYHAAGVPIEIHAGEWCGPESVRDALEYGCPSRIGHGVTLFQDPELVRIFQERQIHVEMCPTSNLKTGSISRIEDHPIRRALDLGLSFSVNTDDPGPFRNSMASEYELLERVFSFQEADFHRLHASSLAARFEPEFRGTVE